MKKIIIATIVLVLSILFAIYILGDTKEKDKTEIQNTEFPIIDSNNETPAAAADIQISTSDKGTISVKNFLKNSDVVVDTENQGNYYLGKHFSVDGSVSVEVPDYVITYLSSTQYFNIGLFKEPLGSSRVAAELYLMEQLDISKDEMCLLKYTVSTPNFVNAHYAGKDLKFSFCSGSVILP